MSEIRVSVIIPAAGSSSRYNSSGGGDGAADVLGAARSKLDEDLGGKSVLQRSVELFHTREEVVQVIVAGPFDEAAMGEFRLRHGDRLALLGAELVRGGAKERFETVAAALAHVRDDATHVAIHDAARPAASQALIDRVLDAAARFDAVIPVVPVGDTLKRMRAGTIDDGSDEDPLARILGAGEARPMREVEGTVDRAGLVGVQTPQVFAKALLERAYAQGDLTSTDDASLVERLGERVVTVEGEARNMKLTRAEDLAILRAVMGVEAPKGRASHKKF
jgi:2-C-methyl-D-erythritol 4-phosphate cytidylyltransferase